MGILSRKTEAIPARTHLTVYLVPTSPAGKAVVVEADVLTDQVDAKLAACQAVAIRVFGATLTDVKREGATLFIQSSALKRRSRRAIRKLKKALGPFDR